MDDETGTPDEGPAELELVYVEAAPRSRPWLTILLALVIGIAYLIAQSLVAGAMLAVELIKNPRFDVDAWAARMPSDGTIIALCLIAGTAASVPLTLLFGRLLSGGATLEYLGLRMPSGKSIVQWTLAIVAFAAITDGVIWLLGGEIVPPFMREAYWSARWPALLWLAIVVAAPLSEELLFRGFLFSGLINTRLGFVGTAVLTSASFALLHLQYDLLGITLVFFVGMILAAARQATQSIIPCMVMHAVMNFIATCEVALLTRPA